MDREIPAKERKKRTVRRCLRAGIAVTVTASGNVVPEYQEIIVSPISTRIVETYKKAAMRWKRESRC